MSNELPPPLKTTSGGRSPTIAWLFLSFDGRITREVYWLGLGLLWCVLFVVIQALLSTRSEEEAAGFIVLLAIVSLWCEIALLIKRQHDRGMPWYWCLLAFVPIAGAAWLILAGLLPGDAGPNNFGGRTNAPSGTS